jgi:hypothetical protein
MLILEHPTQQALDACAAHAAAHALGSAFSAPNATTSPTRREAVATAIAIYITYELARRQRQFDFGGQGAPDWDDEQWGAYQIQDALLARIPVCHRLALIDAVEAGELTVEQARAYINTGSLSL